MSSMIEVMLTSAACVIRRCVVSQNEASVIVSVDRSTLSGRVCCCRLAL